MEEISFQFRLYYAPCQYLSFDESMVSFKGKLKFKFYVPSKPTKWGIKIHTLCDSESGYCLNFEIDPGKTIEKPADCTTMETLKIIHPFINKYHIIYMDSYYSSVKLFEDLKEKKTGATGIIRRNRKSLPKEFVCSSNKNPVEISSSGSLLLTKWKDKKQIICISTADDSELIYREKYSNNKKKVVKKIPSCIYNYNKYMRGVDHLDQEIQTYRYPHRNNKWRMKVFHHVLEIAVYNSFLIWKNVKLDKTLTYLMFREMLAKELLSTGKKVHVEGNLIKMLPNEIEYKGTYYVEKSYLHDLIVVDEQKMK